MFGPFGDAQRLPTEPPALPLSYRATTWGKRVSERGGKPVYRVRAIRYPLKYDAINDVWCVSLMGDMAGPMTREEIDARHWAISDLFSIAERERLALQREVSLRGIAPLEQDQQGDL